MVTLLDKRYLLSSFDKVLHFRYEELVEKYNVEYIAGGISLDLEYWIIS